MLPSRFSNYSESVLMFLVHWSLLGCPDYCCPNQDWHDRFHSISFQALFIVVYDAVCSGLPFCKDMAYWYILILFLISATCFLKICIDIEELTVLTASKLLWLSNSSIYLLRRSLSLDFLSHNFCDLPQIPQSTSPVPFESAERINDCSRFSALFFGNDARFLKVVWPWRSR